MRILMVTSHMNPGGITSYINSLARVLKSMDIEVEVASGGGTLAGSDKIFHHDIGIKTKSELSIRTINGAIRLKSIGANRKIDILHAHTRVAAFASMLSGLPYLTTAHGYYRAHLGRRILPCWGKKVIAVSHAVEKHLEEDFKLSSSRIRCIHTGIKGSIPKIDQIQIDQFMNRYKINPKIPRWVILARLSSVKGHEDLFHALGLLKTKHSYQCLVVGDGPDREKLLRLTKKIGIEDQIIFIHDLIDPNILFRCVDLTIMPSHQEGLGLTALESQAMGVPVVASSVGGLPEALRHEQTGLLVPPKDPQSLADVLSRLIRDPALLKRLGANGPPFINKNFLVEDMAEKVINVYRKIMQKGGL